MRDQAHEVLGVFAKDPSLQRHSLGIPQYVSFCGSSICDAPLQMGSPGQVPQGFRVSCLQKCIIGTPRQRTPQEHKLVFHTKTCFYE